MATEAIDAGFTRWRRQMRKPSGISAAVGVMAHAYKMVAKQVAKPTALSGFRLENARPIGSETYLDRFRQLTLDERAVLVMRDVLAWSEADIAHAVGAQGIGPVIRSLTDRLHGEGIDPERMAEALRSTALGFTEPLSRLDSVKAKGGAQRLGLLLAAGVAVAVLAAVVVAFAGREPASPPPVASGAPSTVIGGVGLTADNAVWQRVPAPMDGNNLMTIAHDGENFLMLGMDQRGRPAMLVSDNGLDWASMAAPPVGQGAFFQHLAAKDERLVLVGNGFDEIRGDQSTIVFTTTDREIWEEIQLPVDDQVEFGGLSFDVYTWVNALTVSDDGFTVVGNQGAEIDPQQLLADLVDPELFRNGWGFTNQGLEFYDNNGNVSERRTWEELGIDPAVGTLLGGRPILWKSPDGIEWERVEADAPPNSHGMSSYLSTEDFEAALTWGDFGQSMWIRSEGEWERPQIDGSLTAMTMWNGRLIVAGLDSSTGQPSMWSSADGVEWERAAVGAGNVHQFFTSDAGIVGFGFLDAGAAMGPAEFSVDELTVTATSDGRYVVRDAAGDVLVEVFEENVVRGDTVAINDPETGATVVEFSEEQLENAWNEALREVERFPGNAAPQMSILLSTDGSNWTALQHDEAGFFAQSVAVGNNSLLLLGWNEGADFLGFGGGGGQELWLVSPASQ